MTTKYMNMVQKATRFAQKLSGWTIILLLAVSPVAFAQTGPGGVGNADGSVGQPKNVIWLDAGTLGLTDGANVSTWADKSGNGYTFGASSGNNTATLGDGNTSQLPSFESDGANAMNGFPVVQFSGNAERLVANPFNDFPATDVTTIIVFKTTAGGDGIVSYAVGNGNASNEYLIYDAGETRTFVDGSSSQGGNFTTPAGNNIFVSRWTNAGGTIEHFKNGSLQTLDNGTIENGTSIEDGGSLAIGGEQDNVDDGYATDQDFNGNIAEVIMYGSFLNESQRALVENYLSAKYGIDLNAGDYYAGDEAGNGNYDQDLIGIGQLDGSVHERSGTAGLVFDTLGTSLETDGEFVIAAHKAVSNALTTANLGSGVVERWSRTWYIDKTTAGTLGAIIGFDFGEGINGQFPQDKDSYELLRLNGGTGNYEVVPLAATRKYVSGDRMYFKLNDANLVDGLYTLGTTDATASPLVGGPNKTWYSYGTGDWEDSDTWTLDGGNPASYDNPADEIPGSIDNVVINNNKRVTLHTNNVDVLSLEVSSGGKLDLEATLGHNFNTISSDGSGRVLMMGSSGQDNFPEGTVTGSNGFADASNGGTLVIYGSGVTLDQARDFRNIEVQLDAGATATLLADYSLTGDLTVEQGTLRFNDNSSSNGLNVRVDGNVTIENGGAIATGSANARHQFDLYGDLINNGTAAFTNRTVADYDDEATNGIVDVNFLHDSQDQEIQCNGLIRFYRLEIDKGTTDTYVLSINTDQEANFNLLGPADYGHASLAQLDDNRTNTNQRNLNALGLYRGTVRLGTGIKIPVLSTTGNYNISEAARLWVDGGEVLKNTGSAIVPYGKIEVDAGLLEARIGNGITTRNNGLIRVDGGTINTNQIRTSVLGDGNVGGYVQTGGVVNLLGNSTQTDYYVFCLTYPGNVFIMKGGELNIKQSRGKGGLLINSNPENVEVTEGTVNFEIGNDNDFIVTSRAPFWNVNMRNPIGSTTRKVVLGAGVDVSSTNVNLPPQPLVVLNNLTVENNTVFDHNGEDVTIGRNFTIEPGGVYYFGSGTEDPNAGVSENLTAPATHQNTTTFNGTAAGIIKFNHLSASGTNVEQVFHNVVVDKPSGVRVALRADNKPTDGNNNNAFRTLSDGSFTLTSGTFDQGTNSVRFYGPITNYDTLGVFEPGVTRNNALLKFRPRDFTIETKPGAVFGNFKLNNGNRVITFDTDVEIQRMEYRHGRIDIGTHNLRVNYLDVDLEGAADYNNCNGCFSVEDMIITAGNASDGGLTLRIPADGNNPVNESIVATGNGGQVNPNLNFADRGNGNRNFPNTEFSDEVFLFPVGVRQTTSGNGNPAQDQFTPLMIDLGTVDVGADGEGYITVNPVADVLNTTEVSGGGILNYYWRIRPEGFEVAPQVNYVRAFGYNRDLDPASTVTDGPDATYTTGLTSGGVLDAGSFQRFDDGEAAINPNLSGLSTEAVGGPDFEILFNGNAVLGDPAPFSLQDANLTLGDPNRFIGAPEVYYSRRVSSNYNIANMPQWEDPTTWSTVSHTGGAATDFPQVGDIAIVGYGTNGGGGGGPRHHVAIRSTMNVNVARTVVNSSPVLGVWDTRLFVEQAANINLGIVEGNGTIEYYIADTSVPDVTADFGAFTNNYDAGSQFLFFGTSGTDITLPPTPTVYPNVRVEGNGNRTISFPVDVTINKTLTVDNNATLRTMADITVDGSFRVGGYLAGKLEFSDNAAHTVTVTDDLWLRSNNNVAVRVDNNTENALEHRLVVGGDIRHEQGTMDLFSNNTGGNNVILEVAGTANASYTNATANVPELYRVVVNKGDSQDSVFSFQNNFTLNGPTDTGSKAIELQNGTLRLDDTAINIDLNTGNEPFIIPATTALDIQQGQVNVRGDDTGILLDGLLRLNGSGARAYFNGAGNGNNYIEYSASGNASLQIYDGELIVGSQIRRGLAASNGSLNYFQSGGTVTVGANAAPESTRGIFEITGGDGSSFTHTGGELRIVRGNGANPGIAALYLNPDNSYVTGGSTITLGHTSTPSGQTIGVSSAIALNDLVVDNVAGNAVTAQLVEQALTVAGDFSNDTGATFDANGFDFTLMGNYVNDGVYTANGNTTAFSSNGTQTLTGSGSNDFYNVSKDNGGTLTLSQDILVNHDLWLLQGTLADNGNTVEVKGDLTLDGTHTSTGGNGIMLTGDELQNIRRTGIGESLLGVLTIDNAEGVSIPEGQGYDFTIANRLRLSQGTFNVGSSLITLSANATIEEVNPFGANNMIRTNSSFNDAGVRKIFPAGTTTDFVFPVGPVGEDVYSPVFFDFSTGGNSSGSTQGSITIVPTGNVVTVVNDGNNNTAPSDPDNVLQYFWNLEANNLTNFTADAIFTYDQSDIRTLDIRYDESDYIPARILSTSGDVNKFSETLLDEATNEITFGFNGVNQAQISGDYFAGVDEAIPDNIPVYHTTNGGGNYAVATTWAEPIPVGGPTGSIVIVGGGHELTLTTNRINSYRIEVGGGSVLDVGSTTQHNLGEISGTGTIRTESDVLPAGSYKNFLVCGGGRLEYSGTTNYGVLAGITEIHQVTFSGSGTRTLPGANLRICEDMVVAGPAVDNESNVNVVIDRDLLITSGSLATGANTMLSVARHVNVSNGTYQGESGHTNTVRGNVTLSSGAFTAGNNSSINVGGNVTYSGGIFSGSSGNAIVTMQGSSPQVITGNFNGASAFNRLQINNSSGLQLINNVSIKRELLLTNGHITAPTAVNAKFKLNSNATAAPANGRATSFVNGKLYKDITNGDSFTFPVGKDGRWGYASIDPTPTASHEWCVEYFDASPETIGLTNFNFTSSDSDIKTISRGEYWRIDDDATGVLARVGLMWDGSSDVSANASEWYALSVMAWNETSEKWDSHRGTGHDSNPVPTTNHGFFTSIDPVTFSTRYVTLGSTEENNALPVELVSFTATAKAQTVVLTWETASEINNDYFEVLRSVDGINFKKIGEVAGAGNSDKSLRYEFADKLPVAGVAYYQLKQVDYNGMYDYSDKVSVEWISTGEYAAFVELNLYPNPAAQGEAKLRVTGLQPRSAVTVKLLDMFGKVHLQQVIEADRLGQEGYLIQPRARLSAGVYVVSVQQGSQVHQKTLIVR